MHSRLISGTLALALLGLLAVFSGCDSSDPEATGTVTGTILYPDGETPVGGATVTLAGAELARPGPGQQLQARNAPMATTDSEGRFTLEDVPEGDQTLRAQRGLFSVTFPVSVVAGVTTDIPPTSLEQDGQFASIPGSYDSMHNIGEELQIEIDIVQTSIFNDLSAVSEYGMVFLNCATQISNDQARANAISYMEAGGTIYISDLSGQTASALVPGLETGGSGGSQGVEASVAYPGLAEAIGKNTVDISYNLSGWRRIQEIDPAIPHLELLRGTLAGAEESEVLAAVVGVGDGQLVYTTFHNTAGLEDDQRAILRYMIGVGGSSIIN